MQDQGTNLDKRTDTDSAFYGTGKSATGTVYEVGRNGVEEGGLIFLPVYNLTGMSSKMYNKICAELFSMSIEPFKSNFLWLPFNLKSYFLAHRAYAEGFKATYGVSIESVIAFLGTILRRVFRSWIGSQGEIFLRHLQRAYDGPCKKDQLFSELYELLPHTIEYFQLSVTEHGVDLEAASELFELNENTRKVIDLAYAGPHQILLPFGEDYLFIDYAWIFRRLYDLFYGVNIPDQNFKGYALEKIVRQGGSILPKRECHAFDGTRKQIDAAFAVNDTLIIVECRAIGRSIGYDRGNRTAIEFRSKKIEMALRDVDDKARWLARHKTGTNYDINDFHRILPIVVTPFAEFIHSLDTYYWLTEDLPRVITPDELKKALEDGALEKEIMSMTNTVSIE